MWLFVCFALDELPFLVDNFWLFQLLILINLVIDGNNALSNG